MSRTDKDWRERVNELESRIDQYDSLTTKIRNILTQSGIPDHECYPDEDVDEREKSLRTGGRMIPLERRVEMLADKVKKSEKEVRRLERICDSQEREINRLQEEDYGDED